MKWTKLHILSFLNIIVLLVILHSANCELDEDLNEVQNDVNEFLKHFKDKGRNGLYEEYEEIPLKPKSLGINLRPAYENIDANIVYGADQASNAYLLTEGPIKKDVSDFWRMVWDQFVMVIVMTSRTVDDYVKFAQYWPIETGTSLKIGENEFEIIATKITKFEDYIVTNMQLKNLKLDELREVTHFQYLFWPDFGVPKSPVSILHLLKHVNKRHEELSSLQPENFGKKMISPILIHCRAGLGRTGTFTTIDMAIRNFENDGDIDIQETLEHLRRQRPYTVETPEQYLFVHLVMVQYLIDHHYIQNTSVKLEL